MPIGSTSYPSGYNAHVSTKANARWEDGDHDAPSAPINLTVRHVCWADGNHKHPRAFVDIRESTTQARVIPDAKKDKDDVDWFQRVPNGTKLETPSFNPDMHHRLQGHDRTTTVSPAPSTNNNRPNQRPYSEDNKTAARLDETQNAQYMGTEAKQRITGKNNPMDRLE